MGEQGADLVPDRKLQEIGAHLGLWTEALTTKPIGVSPKAPVIRIGSRPAFACTRTQGFAIKGIAAVLALEYALEQIAGPTP
jgi:hypothetical protein